MAEFSREEVTDWVSKKMDIPCHFAEDYQVLYDTKDGSITVAVVYENYLGKRNIHMHVAAEGNWMTRDFIEHAFRYPFEKLNCARVTGLVHDPKKLEFYQLLGFKVEGCLRDALDEGDLYIMGMLRDECRFIDGKEHTKRATAA